MSSFLCFICHSTVSAETNEELREKYRDIVGMHLCPDLHLCHICCHLLNKLTVFKSICLKRSLEYPELFSDKGILNLQRNSFEIYTICPDDDCGQYHNRNTNSKTYHLNFSTDSCEHHQDYIINRYVELNEERKDFDNYFNHDLPDHSLKRDLPVTDRQVKNETDYNDDYPDNYSQDNCSEDVNSIELNEETKPLNTEIDSPDNNEENVYLLQNEETISNEEPKETTEKQIKKKHKAKKHKKPFEKIKLTIEEQKADLEAKRKEKKYLEAEFKCFNCALAFLFKDTYQAHMMRHEESNGEYRCSICTLRFASPAVLRAHASAHGARYRCGSCGKAMRPRSKATHGRRCRGDGHCAACHLCGGVFADSGGLQRHLKRVHHSQPSLRRFSCNVCGKSYSNQAAVRTHMIKHINRKFDCDRCSSTFSSPYTLNQHKKKHVTAPEQHYCTTCGVSYSSRKSLLAHRRTALHHQQTLFECPICTRTCPNQRSLASHMEAVHSGTKNYMCPRCPARYSNRKSLVRHIGAHDRKVEPKQAVCQLCGASFKGNNKLNRHLREVCEKARLQEEIANLYEQECMNAG